MTSDQARWFARAFGTLVGNVEQAVIGKQHTVRLALTCLLSEGHLLLEDYPGTGKTSLAKAIANSVKGTHSRIQFTPDLLPSDVTGVTIYDQRTGAFNFHGGPIFATIVPAHDVCAAGGFARVALRPPQVHGVPPLLSNVSRLARDPRRRRPARLGPCAGGCLPSVRAAKTGAAAGGRGYVVPDDIKELAVP